MTVSMLSQRSFVNRRLILMMIKKLILSSTKNQVQMINFLSVNQMIVSRHHLSLLARIGPFVEERERTRRMKTLIYPIGVQQSQRTMKIQVLTLILIQQCSQMQIFIRNENMLVLV
jgi:hypothetical protein